GLAQAVSVFRIDEAKLSGIAAPRSAPARAPAPKASAAGTNGVAASRQANGNASKRGEAEAEQRPAGQATAMPAALAGAEGDEWTEF
ncbi:hypothetical protein, partial [Wenzhouxiangella sp. XN24]|uniref:hypothetical protein n=1 Tax=Wenzhouxiangella sp. XN24 TaxID=2713569 RepID=UPI0013F03BFD